MIPFGSKKAVWEHWEDFHAPFTDDSGEEKFPELKVTVHDDPSMLTNILRSYIIDCFWKGCVPQNCSLLVIGWLNRKMQKRLNVSLNELGRG